MSSKVFHIEIEVDNLDDTVDGQERTEACIEAVRNGARQIFTSCMFIVGERYTPKISVWGEDIDSGRTDVSLKEDT